MAHSKMDIADFLDADDQRAGRTGTTLDSILYDINADVVRLRTEETQRAVEHLNKLMDELVKEMKKDPLFACIFRYVYWAGSYFDRLKVHKPDEFDVNLVLKLPLDVLIDSTSLPGGLIKIKFPSNWQSLEPREFIRKLIDNMCGHTRCLKQDSIREWIQGLLTKSINSLKQRSDFFKSITSTSASGPAFTLHVKGRVAYDVDISALIELPASNWPPKPVTNREDLKRRDGRWFAVPKPRYESESGHHLQDDTAWSADFHNLERKLLEGKYNLKPTLRLLKRLRDKEGWSDIKSYWIKTLFLWEAHGQHDSFWRKGLGELLLLFLEKWKNSMSGHNLKDFWVDDRNLIKSMNKARSADISNRLQVIIKKLNADPTKAWEFFG